MRPYLLLSLAMTAACSSGISDVAPSSDEDSGASRDSGTDGASVDSALDGGATDTTVATDTGGTRDGGGPPDGITGDVVGFDTGAPCKVAVSGDSTGCTPDEYCDAPTCDTGTCKARPSSHSDYNPSCGCDGVTYWNPVYAHSQGRSTKGAGACPGSTAKTCGGFTSGTCPGAATAAGKCVISGTDSLTCTTSDLGGVCWAFPPDADCSGGSGKKVRTCVDSSCISLCNATKGTRVFYDDATCGG